MKSLYIIPLLFVFMTFWTPDSLAQYRFNPGEKSAKKEMSRWSLSQWLEQKNNIKLMDYWLSFNSPSPYEFYLIGGHADHKIKFEGLSTYEENRDRINYGFGAFAHIVGIEGEFADRGKGFTDWTAQFTLKLLGHSIQGTHLNLHYGVKNFHGGGDKVSNQYVAASLSLYLLKFFGIKGNYRQYFEAESDSPSKVKGDRVEGGGFIDFSFIRLYGNWYQENIETVIITSDKTERTDEGIQFGLQLFF